MSLPSLGILDFGYINPPKLHAYQTINSLFEEVAQYEALGYKRLWLSEHYSPEFAWFNPEILLPLLAGYSEKIRVGLAGVLLSYHSPLLVAQNFKLLSAVYNDRIDLGIARAHVSERTGKFLVSNTEMENINADWENKVAQLLLFLRQNSIEESLLEKMTVPPHGTMLPEMWLLGASGHSVDNTVKNQCNFCISFMHPGSDFNKNKDTLKIFKEKYYAKNNCLPQTAVLLCGVHVRDKIERQRLENEFNQRGDVNIFGEKNFIIDRLHALKEIFDNDEFILFNPYFDRSQRMESFATIIN